MAYRPHNRTRSSAICTLLLLAVTAVSSGCRWGGAAQNGIGLQMYQQGRYAEALQQFELAKQTDPTNPDTYYNLASSYTQLAQSQSDPRMLQQAEVLYNQCLDLSPNHVDCHRALAVMLAENKRSDEAFRLLQNWSTTNPTASDPKVELARLQSEFGQQKTAQQTLDDAINLDPNNARAWAARGKLREDTGDLMQAVQNYQQSLALNAVQPDLFQRVAALNVRMAQNTISNANSAIIASGQNSPTTNPNSTAPATKRY